MGIAAEIQEERRRRGLQLSELAKRAGMAISTVHRIESGAPASLVGYARLAEALDLDLRLTLRPEPTSRVRDVDPGRAAMGEVEARHLGAFGHMIRLDEPYQHFQFAGRADLVAINPDARALLHLENRTRFPDIQAYAGSWNQKRIYLAPELAKRFGVDGGFRSITPT
jgi:transcriptional regulator with XRE-family HTH domain